MTTINDPVRMSSMFTMNGLTDPRFFEEAVGRRAANLARPKRKEFLNLTYIIEAFALKRSIFRFKRIRA